MCYSDHGIALRDWVSPHDTTSLYHRYIGDRTHIWGSYFNVPEIRDRNGVLVPPTEWENKLVHMTPVTIDVALKL